MKLKTASLIALICVIFHLIFGLLLLLQPIRTNFIFYFKLFNFLSMIIFNGGIILFLLAFYYAQADSQNIRKEDADIGKKTIVVTMASISLVIDVLFAFIGILHFDCFTPMLEKIQFFYWGWLFAFILPSVSIAVILYWKLWSEVIRGFLLFFLILSLSFAGFWFILFCISQIHIA